MTEAPGEHCEPRWLTRMLMDAMHAALVEQYGGMHGVNNEALIESAVARPQNVYAYVPESDLATLAASLCFGVAKNHGYRDGNKRTAFAAAAVFLKLNGLRLMVPEPEVVAAMVYLAADVWNEVQLADWVRDHLHPGSHAE